MAGNDRRIGKRIRQLNSRLEQVDKRRTMSRQTRVRAEIPTVALVGYTNAGKSTLFNRLTDASVYVEDQLFAYAECMRENGYDMPDPIYVERTHTPGQGGGGDGGPFGKLDRTDPDFIEANEVCQAQFEDLWTGPGGGPGGGGGGDH